MPGSGSALYRSLLRLSSRIDLRPELRVLALIDITTLRGAQQAKYYDRAIGPHSIPVDLTFNQKARGN